MRTRTRLAHLGLALTLLLATAPALPQETQTYTVEIVVFRSDGQIGALSANTQLPVVQDEVTPAPVTSRKLSAAANRLRGTTGFRVLAHASWSQEPSPFNSRRGVSTQSLGIDSAGIRGKVMLERGRYLHLGLDLEVSDAGQRYRISEVRQVKPDEVQYFDHPAIGVIAVVSDNSKGK